MKSIDIDDLEKFLQGKGIPGFGEGDREILERLDIPLTFVKEFAAIAATAVAEDPPVQWLSLLTRNVETLRSDYPDKSLLDVFEDDIAGANVDVKFVTVIDSLKDQLKFLLWNDFLTTHPSSPTSAASEDFAKTWWRAWRNRQEDTTVEDPLDEALLKGRWNAWRDRQEEFEDPSPENDLDDPDKPGYDERLGALYVEQNKLAAKGGLIDVFCGETKDKPTLLARWQKERNELRLARLTSEERAATEAAQISFIKGQIRDLENLIRQNEAGAAESLDALLGRDLLPMEYLAQQQFLAEGATRSGNNSIPVGDEVQRAAHLEREDWAVLNQLDKRARSEDVNLYRRTVAPLHYVQQRGQRAVPVPVETEEQLEQIEAGTLRLSAYYNGTIALERRDLKQRRWELYSLENGIEWRPVKSLLETLGSSDEDNAVRLTQAWDLSIDISKNRRLRIEREMDRWERDELDDASVEIRMDELRHARRVLENILSALEGTLDKVEGLELPGVNNDDAAHPWSLAMKEALSRKQSDEQQLPQQIAAEKAAVEEALNRLQSIRAEVQKDVEYVKLKRITREKLLAVRQARLSGDQTTLRNVLEDSTSDQLHILPVLCRASVIYEKYYFDEVGPNQPTYVNLKREQQNLTRRQANPPENVDNADDGARLNEIEEAIKRTEKRMVGLLRVVRPHLREIYLATSIYLSQAQKDLQVRRNQFSNARGPTAMALMAQVTQLEAKVAAIQGAISTVKDRHAVLFDRLLRLDADTQSADLMKAPLSPERLKGYQAQWRKDRVRRRRQRISRADASAENGAILREVGNRKFEAVSELFLKLEITRIDLLDDYAELSTKLKSLEKQAKQLNFVVDDSPEMRRLREAVQMEIHLMKTELVHIGAEIDAERSFQQSVYDAYLQRKERLFFSTPWNSKGARIQWSTDNKQSLNSDPEIRFFTREAEDFRARMGEALPPIDNDDWRTLDGLVKAVYVAKDSYTELGPPFVSEEAITNAISDVNRQIRMLREKVRENTEILRLEPPAQQQVDQLVEQFEQLWSLRHYVELLSLDNNIPQFARRQFMEAVMDIEEQLATWRPDMERIAYQARPEDVERRRKAESVIKRLLTPDGWEMRQQRWRIDMHKELTQGGRIDSLLQDIQNNPDANGKLSLMPQLADEFRRLQREYATRYEALIQQKNKDVVSEKTLNDRLQLYPEGLPRYIRAQSLRSECNDRTAHTEAEISELLKSLSEVEGKVNAAIEVCAKLSTDLEPPQTSRFGRRNLGGKSTKSQAALTNVTTQLTEVGTALAKDRFSPDSIVQAQAEQSLKIASTFSDSHIGPFRADFVEAIQPQILSRQAERLSRQRVEASTAPLTRDGLQPEVDEDGLTPADHSLIEKAIAAMLGHSSQYVVENLAATRSTDPYGGVFNHGLGGRFIGLAEDGAALFTRSPGAMQKTRESGVEVFRVDSTLLMGRTFNVGENYAFGPGQADERRNSISIVSPGSRRSSHSGH